MDRELPQAVHIPHQLIPKLSLQSPRSRQQQMLPGRQQIELCHPAKKYPADPESDPIVRQLKKPLWEHPYTSARRQHQAMPARGKHQCA